MRIAIIGAGFSGLSVAWHLLLKTECAITLFERKGLGEGASGIAAGLLHPYPGEQGRRSVFATEGIAATKALIQVAENELNEKIAFQNGIIRYVQNEQQRQMFLSHCHQFGDVKQRSGDSFWIGSGMTIDCPRYLDGLWRALSKKGVQLVLKEVTELSCLERYDQIVVTAGAGTKQFPELDVLRISTLKGQVLKCRVPKSVQLPEASAIGKGYVALSQEAGTCFIGSTYQRGDLTDIPQPELAKEVLFPKVGSFFPSVEKLEVIDCRAAFRVMRIGHYLPIATRVKENIWVLTAMGSRGLLYHAHFGKELAREILKD
jgi:glycine/D-amino acid oxidase-like deaminating enzyme